MAKKYENMPEPPMRPSVLPVLGPRGDEDDVDAMAKTIRSGWWVNGPKTEEFETKFAEMVGHKYAVALTSNTAGLDLVLKAYNIQNCDVISPTISFATTVAVPMWNNCTSRLADVDPVNHNIDPEDVKRILRPDTKAIICVNMAGIPAPIDEIRTFFTGLIIEDCAHSCYVPGSGLKGDVAIWSFQGVKTMPCGDGGMVTTDSEEIANKIRSLSWFGIESTYRRDKHSGRFEDKKGHDDLSKKAGYRWQYDIKELGYKAYMIDLNATLCLSQMKKLEQNLARRRHIQERYNNELGDLIQVPPFSHTVQYYCAKVPPEYRAELIGFLASKNIHTSVHFRPLHQFTYFKEEREFPVADREWLKLISLPVHLNMSDTDIDYVIYWVRKFFESKRPKPTVTVTPVFQDQRGTLIETFKRTDFKVAQENTSFTHKGVIRGLHYQPGQSRLLRVLSGSIRDVCVDVKTGKVYSFDLNSPEQVLHVPPGFAHAFLAKTDNTIVVYQIDTVYSPSEQVFLHPLCPTLKIDWGWDSPILSDKDTNALHWEEFSKLV